MLQKLLTVGSCLTCVTALYEKEAGHYDWKLSLIGKPTGILESASAVSTVLVTSSSGNLASLKADSGKLVWKTRLSNAPIHTLIDSGKGHIVTQSGDLVSVIDAASGALRWTSRFPDQRSFALCEDKLSIELAPQGTVIDLLSGESKSYSGKCDIAGVKAGLSAVKRDGVTISASDFFITGKRGDKTLWTRDESLTSVDAVVVVGDDGGRSQHDLAWLIGGWRIAAALSREAKRVVLLDIASGTVKGSVAVDSSIVGLSKGENFRINLLNASGSVVSILDPLTATVTPSTAPVSTSPIQYAVDESTGEMSGFIGGNRERKIWQISLQSKILTIVTKSHSEYAHVPVLVKGDASVVFNYVNPNLVVVLASNGSGVTVNALDTVTGALVYQTLLPNASPDLNTLHFILCDNWIVGHYFNTDSLRFEVIVVDFFEKRPDKGFYAIATGQEVYGVDSAFALPVDPVAISQQYVFPLGPVTVLAVTATLKGVTPRQILFATNNGLYAIRKDFWLNPRRPGGPPLPARLVVTAEESLPPYTPILPIVATDFVSHAHVLEGVNNIVSFATHLESTSVIVSFGEDVFASPVFIGNAPFDVLSPFFNFWLLYVSLAVVAVVVTVTGVMAGRKDLYDKWK